MTMRKRFFRWLRIIAIVLVRLIALLAAGVYIAGELRLNRTYTIKAEPLTIPNDPATIVRGQHVTVTRGGCRECHGANLAGKVLSDDPLIGRIVAPNLTRGQGGVGGEHTDADWVRAIRHAIDEDGKPLRVMPVDDYQRLAADDLAAIIAYVKSVPPVDSDLPASQIGPLGRVLLVINAAPLLPAEHADHTVPIPGPVLAGVTVSSGQYLAATSGCISCHGPGLSGGPIPDTPPDWPPASNITPSGWINTWSEAAFIRALREGKRPGGAPISAVMPWRNSAQMTDDELSAMLVYLRSVPAKPYGGR